MRTTTVATAQARPAAPASGSGAPRQHGVRRRVGGPPAVSQRARPCGPDPPARRSCGGVAATRALALGESPHALAPPAPSRRPHSAWRADDKVAASRRSAQRRRIGSAFTCVAVGAASVAAAPVVAAGGMGTLSQVLAVVVGYCVLIGSLFRGVPQIVKVWEAQSTEGLSLTSNVVELLCYTVVLAYNVSQGYAFNTFGEVMACWVQDALLVALIAKFTRRPLWQSAAFGLAVAALCAYLIAGCPRHVLAALQASTVLVMALGSRLPQILLNVRRGNSGVLSVTSCGLNVAGNLARIFTTLVLTGDPLILGGALTQGCLNGVLLYQSVQTELLRRRGLLVMAPHPT